MNFTPTPIPEDQESTDEPGVMHIGGPRGRRVRSASRWIAVILVVAAMMVGVFIRFGTTTLWACGLVVLMISYMLVMGRWAGGDRR